MGQVVVQLIGQRRQRPALSTAGHDLLQQVSGELFGLYFAWHPEHIRR
jgi:hypothetical protein